MALAELPKLPPVPGTRDELVAVARVLGAAPGRALCLDRLNGMGELGKARVVAFATHALIAGEVQGLLQPALVLTPPAAPSAEDDGLLGLEEIVGLKLTRTEWLILSPCNTAASDGSGEGLPGLARAFFFAGAPSLLVSHWSVKDRATQELMTEVFRRYAADRGASRAEAVRQRMLALMGQGQGAPPYFAHPFAGAAFFLVGEGGGEKKYLLIPGENKGAPGVWKELCVTCGFPTGSGRYEGLLGDNYICASCCLRKECYQGPRPLPAQF